METKEVQFPLDDLDIANIHEFAALLRNRVNKMNPMEMLTASTLLFALDRLPYVTPGIDVSMTIRRNCLEDFSDWIDIRINEDELELGSGTHIYTPGVGGDTESRTDYETQSGDTWHEGDTSDWIKRVWPFKAEGKISVVDESEYDTVRDLMAEQYEALKALELSITTKRLQF